MSYIAFWCWFVKMENKKQYDCEVDQMNYMFIKRSKSQKARNQAIIPHILSIINMINVFGFLIIFSLFFHSPINNLKKKKERKRKKKNLCYSYLFDP